MKKYIGLICIFSLLMSILCSCREDNTQLAKDEFSKFHTDNDVALVYSDNIYFDTHILSLDEIVEGEESNGGYLIKNGKIYFSTARKDSSSNFSLLIYECDYYGQNLKLLFEKNNYNTHPWTSVFNGLFYIDYNTKTAFHPSSQKIDSYNILTNEYKNVASGKDCSLKNYSHYAEKSSYESVKTDYFEIQKEGSSEKIIIDDEFINSTVYADSMNKFGYYPWRIYSPNGHVLLIYQISAGDGWNYPYLVFEYDFENEQLVYKLLAFLPDTVGAEIEYLE